LDPDIEIVGANTPRVRARAAGRLPAEAASPGRADGIAAEAIPRGTAMENRHVLGEVAHRAAAVIIGVPIAEPRFRVVHDKGGHRDGGRAAEGRFRWAWRDGGRESGAAGRGGEGGRDRPGGRGRGGGAGGHGRGE